MTIVDNNNCQQLFLKHFERIMENNQEYICEIRQKMIVNEDGDDGFHRCDDIFDFEEFIQFGYKPDNTNCCGETPLFHRKNPAVVRRLIEMGLDVNHRNNNNETPLFSALSLDVAIVLVENGADVNAVSDNGETALFRCSNGNVANYLIMKGLDVNYRNNRNETPLMTNYSKDVMEVLIEHGADVNAVGGLYETAALHTHEDENHLRLLLAANANIEIKDGLGRTPLFYMHSPESARILLENGANIYTADDNGTPLIEFVNDNVKEFIMDYISNH